MRYSDPYFNLKKFKGRLLNNGRELKPNDIHGYLYQEGHIPEHLFFVGISNVHHEWTDYGKGDLAVTIEYEGGHPPATINITIEEATEDFMNTWAAAWRRAGGLG